MRRNHSTIHWLNRARVDATVPTAHPGASPQAALTAVVDPHGGHVVAATVVAPATVVAATVVVVDPLATVVVVVAAAAVVVVVGAAVVVVAAAAVVVVVAAAAVVVAAAVAAVVVAPAVVVVQVQWLEAAHPAMRQRKTSARIETMVLNAKDGSGGCDAQA